MRRQGKSAAFTLLLAAVCFLPNAGAQQERFTLGKRIPGDIHFFMNWNTSQARARLQAGYWRALKRLARSGIVDDLLNLLPPREAREVREVLTRIWKILTIPAWERLLEGECAFAFKLTLPFPEYVLLCRVKEGTENRRYQEFRTMLRRIVELSPQTLDLAEKAQHGTRITTLSIANAPFCLSVAAGGNLLLLSTSQRYVDFALGTHPQQRAIAGSPRFTRALRGLPQPEDSVGYLDIAGYAEFYRSLLATAASGARSDPTAQAVIAIADTVLKEVACMPCLGWVERTEKNWMITDSRVIFDTGNGPGFIEELIRERDSIAVAVYAVPKNTKGFYFTSGLNWAKVYHAVLDLIKEKMPEGDTILAQWKALQRRIGIDLDEDLFSWLEGTAGYIAVPGPRRSTDWAFFLKVKDRQRARKVLEGLLSRVQKYLLSHGQRIRFVKVRGLPEEARFREVRIEALPWFRPVVGHSGDFYCLGNSARILKVIAGTLGGNTPNFTENPHFQDLGLPQGRVCEFYWEDVRGELKGLADLLGAVGFVASLVPENTETRPLIKGGACLTKLSLFLRDLDLGLYSCGWTTYDEQSRVLVSREKFQVRAAKSRGAKKHATTK